MTDDLFVVPPEGLHSGRDVETRRQARRRALDELVASGAAEEDVTAAIDATVAADAADCDALTASRAAGTAFVVTGYGVPPMHVAESLLGTPAGDASAVHYGFDTSAPTRDQIMAMRQRGMGWAEINAYCQTRKRSGMPR